MLSSWDFTERKQNDYLVVHDCHWQTRSLEMTLKGDMSSSSSHRFTHIHPLLSKFIQEVVIILMHIKISEEDTPLLCTQHLNLRFAFEWKEKFDTKTSGRKRNSKENRPWNFICVFLWFRRRISKLTVNFHFLFHLSSVEWRSLRRNLL